MDKRIIAANALSFFSMVIVYQAFLTVASPLSAIRLPFSLMQLNLWFMFVSLLGVLLFAYTFRRAQSDDVTPLLHGSLAANGLSVLALAAGLAGKTANPFLYIGGLAFPLACGYLDGCLFYLLARHTLQRQQGIAIGLYIALTNGLLFLVQRLVEALTGAPLFLPWPLLLLSLVLIAFLLRPLPPKETAQPVVPQAQVTNHLPLFCSIGILLSLLIGLSSTLDFVEYEEYYRNWHAISRLFLAAGYLAAGWLADHYPVWLPVAALLAKVTVFASYTFVLEGAPLWFTVFVDAFFSPFIILFIIWMFFNVALRSHRPELWAGMGRAIERPFHVLGALAGEMLLEQNVSHGVMSLVYMGLLILAVVLLYRLFLLCAEAWKHSVVAEATAAVKENATSSIAGDDEKENVTISSVATDATKITNAEASAAEFISKNEITSSQTSAENLKKETATENIKNTTATNYATAVPVENFVDSNYANAVPAENFAEKNTETVYDEAAASDYFAAKVSEDYIEEETTAEDFAGFVSEKNAKEQNATAIHVSETQGASGSLSSTEVKEDDSGPLHGDQLRKYQLRYRLTNRETEVLWEILQKHKTAEIAANLYITLPTAKYHISNILQKTGAKNQRELRYLIEKDEQ